MKTKEINVGNIVGLNSYELAVKTGKFDGTLEEYIHKCLTYIKENNYELRGNPFSRTIFLFTNSERNRKSYMSSIYQ